MFDINDVVVYSGYSVCKITETTQRELNGDIVDYFVLKPAFDTDSKIFVPMHNEKLINKMHKVVTESEAYELIDRIPKNEMIWVDNEAQRKEKYKDILMIHDRGEIISVIKTLRRHREEQLKKKRRLHVSDERILKEAEKTLFEEFAFVLNKTLDEVSALMDDKLNEWPADY